MGLGQNIAALRKFKGMTQEKLAEKCNVSRQAVAKWETGESEPSIEKLVALSRVFNISIDILIKAENPLKVKDGINESDYGIKGVDHCEEVALDEISSDEESSLFYNTNGLKTGIVDERTKKAIESNLRMANSGIRLLCSGRISTNEIENEFKTLELLLNDCKRLLYNTLEN